jgi:hypothetical protein
LPHGAGDAAPAARPVPPPFFGSAGPALPPFFGSVGPALPQFFGSGPGPVPSLQGIFIFLFDAAVDSDVFLWSYVCNDAATLRSAAAA